MSDDKKPKRSLRRIVPVQRRGVRMSAAELVRIEPLEDGQKLPLMIRPMADDVDLMSWAAEHRQLLDERLLEHGGILLRGFPPVGLQGLQRFIDAVSGELLEYTYRSTPRTEVEGRIYTSTEYPANQEIPLHNEEAYAREWPMKVFFYCEKAAEEGGRTPIADSHGVYERIPEEIRRRFAERQVMYVRNYGGGVDLSWQDVFQTDDRQGVEAFCRRAGIEWEWIDEKRLRTRQRCQAMAKHPRTGKWLWFNQAHLFHVSSLQPEVRGALLEMCGPENLPRNACYGDGSDIEDASLEEIRRAFREQQVSFPWQEGDILLLDNMAVAHGRTPFRGERKIRVGMSEPVAADGIETR